MEDDERSIEIKPPMPQQMEMFAMFVMDNNLSILENKPTREDRIFNLVMVNDV